MDVNTPRKPLKYGLFHVLGCVHWQRCSGVFKGVFTKMNTGVFRGVQGVFTVKGVLHTEQGTYYSPMIIIGLLPSNASSAIFV